MGEEIFLKDFSEDSVQILLKELYGLEGRVSRLEGERDLNFRVKTGKGISYIFKIAHRDDSRELLEAQHRVMEALAGAEPPAPCPRPRKSATGKTVTAVICRKDGQRYFVRLLTFLDGKFYAHLKFHPPELESSLGKFLGSLDRALSIISEPAFNRYLIWDLKNIRDIHPYLEDIPETGRRNLVHHFIQMIESEVEPVRHRLRRSLIHNDANDHNILVDGSGTRVTGIIDFGDMVYSETIQELAAALAYALMGKEELLGNMDRVVSAYHRVFPLEEPEIQVLFFLTAARLAISVALAAHRLKHEPGNQYHQISAAPAWEVLERLAEMNPVRVTRRLRQSCGFRETGPMDGLSEKEILAKREKMIGRTLSISYRQPLKIRSGYLQYLFDHQGTAYLDTVNNVCHVGHCHPRVVEAAQRQMTRLNTNTRYLYDSFVELAESLCSTLPDPLRVCYFVNSGSEANELAIRMARTYTGQRDFIVIDSAYHGNTNAVIEISPYKYEGPGGMGPSEHVHKVRIPDTFRGEFRNNDTRAGEKYNRDIDETLKDIRERGRGIAGFMAESIMSVAGQIMFPENYLQQVYHRVRQAGGLCVADEVQVGFGRAGSRFWAFELQGVVPDIVTMGKPMGNGHPLAAVATTPEIDAVFNNGMEYFNTFGGNPVSCAIGKTVLEVIRSENLQQHAAEVGNYFLKQLNELKRDHALIGDVRGTGLFLGVELIRDRPTLEPASEEAEAIANRMREQGILISIDGKFRNVIKIKPPLPFHHRNVDFYIENLDRILKSEKR